MTEAEIISEIQKLPLKKRLQIARHLFDTEANSESLSEQEKEKAHILLGLIKGHQTHQQQTRDLEFKVNLAFWTLIIVAAGYFSDHGILQLDANKLGWFLLIVTLLVLAHCIFWMIPIQESSNKDSKRIREYRERVRSIIGLEKIPDYPQTLNFKWVFFEVGITTLLLILVGIVLFWHSIAS